MKNPIIRGMLPGVRWGAGDQTSGWTSETGCESATARVIARRPNGTWAAVDAVDGVGHVCTTGMRHHSSGNCDTAHEDKGYICLVLHGMMLLTLSFTSSDARFFLGSSSARPSSDAL